MLRKILCLILFISLSTCKTVSGRHAANKNTGSVTNKKEGTEKLIPPLAPTAGTLLKVFINQIYESHTNGLGSVFVFSNKDINADYVRLWVCDKDNASTCNPSQDKAKESASGTFTLNSIPAKIMTIHLQSCVNPQNALSPDKLCGSEITKDFVSSVFPLNPPEVAPVITNIQNEQNNIIQQCQNIQDGLKTYIASSDSAKNSDLGILAQNQVNNVDKNTCSEFVNSQNLDTLTNSIPPSPSPSSSPPTKTSNISTNSIVAISLGTFSVLSLIAGMHGQWRLSKALSYAVDFSTLEEKITHTENEIRRLQIELEAINDAIETKKSILKVDTEELPLLEKETELTRSQHEAKIQELKRQLDDSPRKREELLEKKKEAEILIEQEQSKLIEDKALLVKEKERVSQEKIGFLEGLKNEIENLDKQIAEIEQEISRVKEDDGQKASLVAEQNKLAFEQRKKIIELTERIQLFENNFQKYTEANQNYIKDPQEIEKLYPQKEKMFEGVMLESVHGVKDNLNPGRIRFQAIINANDPNRFSTLTREELLKEFLALPIRERVAIFHLSYEWAAEINYQKKVYNWSSYFGVYSAASYFGQYPLPPFSDILGSDSYSKEALERKLEEYENKKIENEERKRVIDELKHFNADELDNLKKELAAVKEAFSDHEISADSLLEERQKLPDFLKAQEEEIQKLHDKKPQISGNPQILELERLENSLQHQILENEEALREKKRFQEELNLRMKESPESFVAEEKELQSRLRAEIGSLEEKQRALDEGLRKRQEQREVLEQKIKRDQTSFESHQRILSDKVLEHKTDIDTLNRNLEESTANKPKIEATKKSATIEKFTGFGIGIAAAITSIAVGSSQFGLAETPESRLFETLDKAMTQIFKSRAALKKIRR